MIAVDENYASSPEIMVVGGSMPTWAPSAKPNSRIDTQIVILKSLPTGCNPLEALPDGPDFYRWIVKDASIPLTPEQATNLQASIVFEATSADLDGVAEAWAAVCELPQCLTIGLDLADLHEAGGVKPGLVACAKAIVIEGVASETTGQRLAKITQDEMLKVSKPNVFWIQLVTDPDNDKCSLYDIDACATAFRSIHQQASVFLSLKPAASRTCLVLIVFAKGQD